MPAAPSVRNMEAARLTLVLGGARSGKSRYAQDIAEGSGRRLVFCATASPSDDPDMRDRIARHRADRDARWSTVEASVDLVGALHAQAAPDAVVLVDCLTLWLTAVMLGGHDVAAATHGLVAALPGLTGPVVFVSNEVGSGIVPDNALARAFRDAQGRLNQAVAAAADAVVLVVAGLPMVLKPAGGGRPGVTT